jgi:flagellar capping protein FliD
MKFSQGKIMSIVFLLAIMLIALMFSMYESEGFLEGARNRTKNKNKTQDRRIKDVNTRVGTLEQSVSTLDTRTSTLETRVGTLESQGQVQSAAPYNNGPVAVQPMDDEFAQ